jgi:hypothetical protein
MATHLSIAPLRHFALGLAVAAGLTCAAHAEKLVATKDGAPAPAVVTEWADDGGKVLLTVRAGVDPKAVADVINAQVPKVQAKVKGGRIQVKGKPTGELVKALTGVDFDDGDLGALAAADLGGDMDLGAGSSLRAKRSANLDKLLADATTVAIGNVVSVEPGSFPEATVTIQVIRGPTGALSKTVRKGKRVGVRPALKRTKAGQVDWSDESTRINAGAWYLRAGDRVMVRIGEAGATLQATLIDRP